MCLTAFATDDFSVAYVAQHSNSRLPIIIKLPLCGHEGSFLLWVLMLSIWTVAVAILARVFSRYGRTGAVCIGNGGHRFYLFRLPQTRLTACCHFRSMAI